MSLFKCIKNFHMSQECGGELSFTEGVYYWMVNQLGSDDFVGVDNAGDTHHMSYAYMVRYFEPVVPEDGFILAEVEPHAMPGGIGI